MRKILSTSLILIAIIVVGTSGIKSVQSSGSAPTGNTGASGSYCTGCHAGTLNTAGGSVVATGLPAAYTASTGYSFSITINHASADRKRWGFAIKAVNASGTAVGTFSTTNVNAGVSSGELIHKNAPSTASANTFTFNNLKWTAPATNALADKRIRFFLVGNAANGTGGTDGDFIYSNLMTIMSTSIASFSPVTATTGATVTIKGVSFTGATAVSFGGTNASSFTVVNDTTITAVVGIGKSGNVSVTSPSGSASLAGFTFCAAPTSQMQNPSACDKFTYKNITYTSSAVIKDTLKTVGGCDSVYLTINATVNPSITGRVFHPAKGAIQNVKVMLTGSSTNTYNSNGDYNASCLNANSSGVLRPVKNNDVAKANGVNSFDVLLVQRHILNITKLTNAYKLIAADVDGSKSISSVDVLRIKRLILGTDTTFTKTVNAVKIDRLWEFVDSSYVFPDSTNPFPFKDSISFNNITSGKSNQSFVGIKLGDVNDSWVATTAKGIKKGTLHLLYDEEKSDNLVRLNISSTDFENIAAMQYTLHFDNNEYEFISIENNKLSIDFNPINANITGNISMLWTDKNAEAKTYGKNDVLFTVILKPKYTLSSNAGLSINNDITNIDAYDNSNKQYNIVVSQSTKGVNKKGEIKDELFAVSPNPGNGNVRVDVLSSENKKLTFSLSDLQGKTLYSKVFEAVKGDNIYYINFKKDIALNKGIYVIKVNGLLGDNTRKIIVE